MTDTESSSSQSGSEEAAAAAPADNLIAQFMDITGSNQDEARQLIETSGGNLQTAVQNYFAMQDGGGAGQADELRQNQANELRQRNIQREGQPQQPNNAQPPGPRMPLLAATGHSAAVLRRLGPPPRPPQTWWQWLTGLVSLPFYFGYYLFFNTFEFFMTLVGRRPITAGSPRQDVLNFIEQFSSTYNSAHPVFFTDSYSVMLREAKRELRFALVYLHSWTHQDSDAFCTDVLSDQALLQLLEQHQVLFWACDVQSREGYTVSQAVRESTYPSLSLIAYRDNRMALVSRIQGLYPAQQVVDALTLAINENETYIQTARQQRDRLQQDQNLRREQESAYEEVLAQDRLRRQQQEDEKRNELLKQEKQLRREKKRERKLQDLEQLRDRLRESLAETEPGADEQDVVRVCLRFPNGQRAQRAFRQDDSLTALYNYAFVQSTCPERFSLWTSDLPKRCIECAPAWTLDFNAVDSSDSEHSGDDDGGRPRVDEADVGTFRQAGLNRAVILVQDDQA